MEGHRVNYEMEGRDESKIGGGRELQVAKPAPSSAFNLLLRVLALILTLVPTILIGTDKQTKFVPMKIVDTLQPVNVPLHASWKYLSAYVYLLVTNAIACGYAAVSLLLAVANRGGKIKYLGTLIFALDAFMVALLYSGVGASSAVGLIAFHGNSHVQWNQVCNVFHRFCHKMLVSTILSGIGSIVFLSLVILYGSFVDRLMRQLA